MVSQVHLSSKESRVAYTYLAAIGNAHIDIVHFQLAAKPAPVCIAVEVGIIIVSTVPGYMHAALAASRIPSKNKYKSL